MRVLLLAPMVPAPEGGGAIPLLLEAELTGLRERHDVTLVTAIGEDPWEAEAGKRLLASDLDVHLADRRRPARPASRWRRRLRLAKAWLEGEVPWRTVWFADPGIQGILDRLASAREFDVVGVQDSAMSVFRLPAGVATVFTHHEVLKPRPFDWRPGPPPRWPHWLLGELDWRRWQGFQRRAWNRFHLVQVFTGRDASGVAELAPEVEDRLRVNPFGIMLPERPDPDSEQPGTVLFVGNFAHPPNRDSVIWLAGEIMPLIWRASPEARLRIVGTAPPPQVRALAGSRVEVIGDAPSVRPYLEQAAVVIAPVRTGGGMRMKVLEAIATGKAVVTTTRGAEGFTEFGEPPLAIADDDAGIAAAVTSLLDDEAARRALAARAREFAVEHHSPSAWAGRTTKIYEEAIQRSKEPDA